MKVVVIGAGNVATSLALELHRLSFDITQVFSRTIDSAVTLADCIGAVAVTDFNKLAKDADLYIFAVTDSALEGIISQLPSNEGIWLHTAGSMPIGVFNGYTKRYGVLYPFQTFTKGRNIEWKSVPLFIEASDGDVQNFLESFGKQISDKVCILSSENRKYVHLTGVFACNFTNYMYTISEQIMHNAGLPFDFVLPLIDETCSKVHSISPIFAQTGPAVRNDRNVMDRHLGLIENEKLKVIYRLLSESIYESSKKEGK